MSLKDLKISFVIPWYGASIPGGAEAECRRTAEELHKAGADVEVLTTCVREFLSDWNEDYHQPGTELVNGVPVKRFPVRKRDTAAFDAVNWKLMHNLPISAEDERVYFAEGVRSDALDAHLAQVSEDRILLFIPYLMGTTYWGAQVRPQQSYIIPCLHDESYAYLEEFRRVFGTCRGLLMQTPAEARLARSILGTPQEKLHIVGTGVEEGPASDPQRFRRRFRIEDPFLFYAGRRDASKNVPLLVEYFRRYVDESGRTVRLVLAGAGDAKPFTGQNDRTIHDLGFLSPQDKADAHAAATALCQPSINESFSLVIMESWLAGTPVLVHAECLPTRDHCLRSNGGLFFASYEEFAACMEFLFEDSRRSQRMGQLGGAYVRANYSWPVVLQRYEQALSTAFLAHVGIS